MFAYSHGWPLYTAATIAAIAVSLLLWFRFRPKKFISGQSLDEAIDHGPYSVGNVQLYHIYSIWCGTLHRKQEFVILEIEGDWFRIGVFPIDSGAHMNRHYEFTGWATSIPNDRHIVPKDLKVYQPDALAWGRVENHIRAN